MSLYSQITDDMKSAMKAGDQARVDTLRMAISGLNSFQKEKQMKEPGATITDDETVVVLQKDVKRRKESIEMFEKGNRADLVAKEEAELAIIAPYIPKGLDRTEIEKIVDEVMATNAKAGVANDFIAVMRDTMKLVKGRADGKAVGEVIKEKLGA